MKSLRETVMLIRPSLSMWTARKFDKKVTADIIDQYGTNKDAGRFNKLLVAQDAIKALVKLKGEFWTEHYRRTVPWTKDGWAMLSTKGYWSYMEWLKEWKIKWEGTVYKFAMDYPALVEDAKRRLNGMFNEKDYPPASEILDRFSFELDYNTVAQWDGKHLAIDLNDEEVDRVASLMEAKSKEKVENAMREVWGRLHKEVKKLAERCSKPDNVFRDSIIGNIADLVGILPTLNITDDPDLEEARRKVERTLANKDPQEIRDDPVKRKETKKEADKILSSMAAFMGG